ncbi:MAG: RsiV family protein [Patescibacteria group bacterium]
MAKKVLIAALLGVAVIVALLLWLERGLPTAYAPTPGPPELVSVSRFVSSTRYAAIDAAYPQFSAADPAFNNRIERIVRDAADEHVADVADNWEARRTTAPAGAPLPPVPDDPQLFLFRSTWEAAQVNERYLSFILRYGGYAGGAHGYERIQALNYDVVSRREVSLAEFFPGDPNYLAAVSGFVREKFRVRFEDDPAFGNGDAFLIEMMEAGTEPTEENFANFTFTDTEIVFHFEQYQVAPYAAGEQTVRMSRPAARPAP